MNDLVSFIENSFLKDLLLNDDITDISYNGKEIFYVNNYYGRRKFDHDVTSDEVYLFLRNISNIKDIPFSLSHPIIDLSFSKYRLNATYNNITKKNNNSCYSFSIRKASRVIKITNNDKFFSKKLFSILNLLIVLNKSFLISGPTSSGKSEFQKYLISLLKENTRVIVIDSINELDINYENKIDITHLILEKENVNGFEELLKTSLRYNPDYVILAEARGKEIEYVINSAMSGISTITTLHAPNINLIVSRIVTMLQIQNKNTERDVLEKTILDSFDVFVQLEKYSNEDGSICRRIKDLALIINGKVMKIYECNEEFKEGVLLIDEEQIIEYIKKQ
ncbi:MAG: ATPase, T2SS/T4P/T4SS family [Bacilli bacterium]